MLDRRIFAVPILLILQGLTAHWASGNERPPAPPDLLRFPANIGEWKESREEFVDPDVKGALRADQLLSRSYLNTSTNMMAGLFIAWFQSQRGGLSQPHSPKVCLPGSGWVPEDTGEITLQTAAGAITVNRYLVVNRGQHALSLYWYQTPRRVIAGEWAAKFWLVPDALRDRRTDTALVRLMVFSAGTNDSPAETAIREFARQVYPMLRATLPR